MSDPEMGELPAELAAELEEAVIGHQLNLVELQAACGYRDAVIFRASALMQARDCPEHEITALAAKTRAEPLAKWVRALHTPGDLGPWDD